MRFAIFVAGLPLLLALTFLVGSCKQQSTIESIEIKPIFYEKTVSAKRLSKMCNSLNSLSFSEDGNFVLVSPLEVAFSRKGILSRGSEKEQSYTEIIAANNDNEFNSVGLPEMFPLTWSRGGDAVFYASENGEVGVIDTKSLKSKQYSIPSSKLLGFKLGLFDRLLFADDGFLFSESILDKSVSAYDLESGETVKYENDGFNSKIREVGAECSDRIVDSCTVFFRSEEWTEYKNFPKQSKVAFYSFKTSEWSERYLSGWDIELVDYNHADNIVYLARGDGNRQLFVSYPGGRTKALSTDRNLDLFRVSHFAFHNYLFQDVNENYYTLRGGELVTVDTQEILPETFEDCVAIKKGQYFESMRNGEISSRGIFFKSAAKISDDKRKVAIVFHGGPLQASSRRPNLVTEKLSMRGYDVLAIDYPGTPGYGDSYLLKGSIGISGMFNAGTTLLEDLEKSRKLKYTNVVHLGSSFGALPILSALQKKSTRVSSAILISPACYFSFGVFPKLANSTRNDPWLNFILGYFVFEGYSGDPTKKDTNYCKVSEGDSELFVASNKFDVRTKWRQTSKLIKNNPDIHHLLTNYKSHFFSDTELNKFLDGALDQIERSEQP